MMDRAGPGTRVTTHRADGRCRIVQATQRTAPQSGALPAVVERLVPTGETVASMPLPGTVHAASLPNSPVMMAGGSNAAAGLSHQATSHAAAASAQVVGTAARPPAVGQASS
jgi:hypothetical protein